MHRLLIPVCAGLVCLICSFTAFADEGMWTFDNFPLAKVNREYDLHLDQAWLDHLRGAAVRLSSGCSASIVSRRRIGADQPSLRARLRPGAVQRRHRLCQGRLSSRQPRGRETLPRHAGGRADRDLRRHRPGEQGHRRQDRPGFRQGPRRRNRRPRKGRLRRQGRQVSLPGDHASTRAASTSSTPTANIPTSGWYSRRRA